MGVVLAKNETKFSYQLADKTTQHRALCLSKVEFPRKRSTLKILESFRKDFISQLNNIEKSVQDSSRIANSSMLIMPELPPNFLLGSAKQVSFGTEIESRLVKAKVSFEKVINQLEQIQEPEQLTQLIFQHELVVAEFHDLQEEILMPLHRPLGFLDENNQLGLQAGSFMQLFAIRGEKLVFQIEPPTNVLTKTVQPTSPTISTSPLPLSTTVPVTTATESVSSTPTTGTTEEVSSTVPSTTTTPVSAVGNTTVDLFGDWTSPTTLRSETTTFNSQDTWYNGWFAQWVIGAYNWYEYLKNSWKIPSIYDIILGVISFIHSICCIMFCICCQRKKNILDFTNANRPSIVPGILKRRFDRSGVSTYPDTESQSSSLKRVPSVRKVQLDEIFYAEEESRPLKITRSSPKRVAPPPPSAPLFEDLEQETVFKGPESVGATPKPKLRGYLRTSIPVYLMESNLSLDK